MSYYTIHACPDRMWYVEKYLVPSLTSQGIRRDHIKICCDKEHRGNLINCMKIFGASEGEFGTWHLQDDIVVCRDFRKITEKYDDGVVAGYVYTKSDLHGEVDAPDLWYSFPCIRIPNKLARECAGWFYGIMDKEEYINRVKINKADDWFFKEFLRINYPRMKVFNLSPNIVDHIDYLVGGSTINKDRGPAQTRARYFEDKEVVEQLIAQMKKDRWL